MKVGAEKMPPAAGRGRFLTLRGVGDAAPYKGRLTGACHPTLQAPQGEDFRVTFFYKPIDIVGFMCYHALTYKKDMLKE